MRKISGVIFIVFFAMFCCYFPSTIVFANDIDTPNYNTLNYKEFNFYSTTHFYCVNISTNKIELFNNGFVTTFGEYGNTDGHFTEIKFFKVLKNGQFVILDNLNRLQFFDNNFDHIKTIQHIKQNNSFLSLGNITSIQHDIYSNIYLLDETNGYILKANSTYENFEIINSGSNYIDAKFTILNSTNEIALLKNNAVSINDKTLQLNEDSFQILSDALNFIYIIQNEKVIKFNRNLEKVDEKYISINSEYSLNLEIGTIFYFENNEIVSLENFASNISNYTPPTDILSPNLLTSNVEICSINAKTSLLSNPYSYLSDITLEENEQIIKLASTQEFENNFAYIMVIKNNTYKLGYVEEKYITLKNLDPVNYSITPIRESIKFYKFPTTKIKNIDTGLLFYGENYNVTREIEFDNNKFLEIKLKDNFVYIFKHESLNSNSSYINTYLQTNAKLSLYNNEKQINLYDNLNKENIILSLNKTTNIKLIKSHGELSEISLIVDNKIINCFVETKYIVKESNLIIPLTILLATICIILLIVLIVKFKKEPTNKNKI